MTLELKAIRREDKVLLKAKTVVITIMDAEEALGLAQEITKHSDKILKATAKDDA